MQDEKLEDQNCKGGKCRTEIKRTSSRGWKMQDRKIADYRRDGKCRTDGVRRSITIHVKMLFNREQWC